jgi:hypothetical protein
MEDGQADREIPPTHLNEPHHLGLKRWNPFLTSFCIWSNSPDMELEP